MVLIDDDRVHLAGGLRLTFHRTLRVPEGKHGFPLPPSFGAFPVHALAAPAERGGGPVLEIAIPLHRQEALWIGFSGAEWRPNAVQIGAGDINVLTGARWADGLHADPQDYLVCPDQPWIDGINAGDGYVRQFVATGLGAGRSIEEQLGEADPRGGIRIDVYAPKPGRFPDTPPPQKADEGPVAAQGMPPPSDRLALGAGGRVRQKLYPDPYGIDTWDEQAVTRVFVHLLDAAAFERLTGCAAPPSPVDAATYARLGLPWFELADAGRSDLPPAERLSGLAGVVEDEGEPVDPASLAVRPILGDPPARQGEPADGGTGTPTHTRPTHTREDQHMTDDTGANAHICVEKHLPMNLMLNAATKAIKEDPANAPSGRLEATKKVGIPRGTYPETFGALLTGKKWKNGRTLRVRHLNGDPTVHAKVERYAKQWEQYANLTLEFVTSGGAEIRIGYATDNQSWSYIGTDALSIPADRETMHYGWLYPSTDDEEYSRVVLHEFGHALGMIHEHMSPNVEIKWDKEAVYRRYEELGWSKEDVDRNLFARFSKAETEASEYDKASIMHYPVDPELTTDRQAVGYNRVLSDMDQQFIGRIYPKPPSAAVPAGGAAAPMPAAAGERLAAEWAGPK